MVIAIWGAVLSTVLAAWELWKGRRHLAVRVDVDAIPENGHPGIWTLRITGTNGRRQTQVMDAAFSDQEGHRVHVEAMENVGTALPITLGDGEAAVAHFMQDEFWQLYHHERWIETAWMRDASGKTWSVVVPPTIQESMRDYYGDTKAEA